MAVCYQNLELSIHDAGETLHRQTSALRGCSSGWLYAIMDSSQAQTPSTKILQE